MITFKSKMDVKNPDDIFAEISARQVAALMIHDYMASFFDFLGLRGYKRLHEYQFYSEGREYRKTSRYYINHHSRMIPESGSKPEFSKTPLHTASRMSVGKSTKQKAVEDCMTEWQKWESETKELYEHYAKEMMDQGMIADTLFIEKLVAGTNEELKKADRLVIDLISAGYDMTYIMESQKEIHDKYKAKAKKLEKEDE